MVAASMSERMRQGMEEKVREIGEGGRRRGEMSVTKPVSLTEPVVITNNNQAKMVMTVSRDKSTLQAIVRQLREARGER
jgi:hypothetical protein